MSSSEDEYPEYIEGGPQIISHLGGGGVDDSKAKKRRVQRACDVCRRKKIKCDGAQKSNGQCSNCISYQYDCTYVEAAKKRGPPKGYVESLENRLEKMEKLLKRMCPDQDFTQELGAPIDRDSWQHDKPTDKLNSPSTFRAPQTTRRPVRAATGIQTGPDTDLDTSDEEGHSIPQAHLSITDRLKELGLSNGDTRFYGKSSGVNLIQTAHQRKSEHVANKNRESDGASPQQQSNFSHRSQFWGPSPWEIKMAQSEETATFDLPPMELIESLVDLFFKYVIPYFPLLHRPTFERHYRDHLQDRDASFASVLLLVCALGSRWSDDSRVLLEPNAPLHSAGWKYFQQVHIFRKSLLAPPSLFDVQMYALAGLFLQSTAFPQAGWTLVGVGLRLVQDVGAHRRKVYAPNISVEDELWKRAVWTLISIDRISSCVLGRPCSLQDEDFDLELPIEVDDEYWTNSDPALAFKQPEGKPSIVSSFIAFLNLMQILAFALRTVYSINKSKILLGFVGQQWEQHIVSELDTALNKWLANVPRHLQWEKNMENETFFAQSAHLYACYYHLQILVHRPFIPSPKRPANHPFPSLNICANAARSCAAIVDYHRRRSKHVAPWTLIAAFNSGIVILLNIWGANKGFVSTDIRLQLEDVHKCMDALSSVEERWHAAGRLVDILRDLSNMGDLPVPPRSPIHAGQKRERDSDSPPSFSPATAQQVPTGSRPMAGRLSKSRPGSRQVSQPQVHIAGPGQHGSFAPVASHQPVELRRVPHNEFSYPSPATAASRDSANWYASPTTPTGLQHHDPSILYGAHHPPMQNPVYHQGPPTAPFPNAYDAPRGAHQPSEGISLITNMPPQAPYAGEHQLSSQPRGPVTLSVGNTDQYVGNEATMAMWSQAPPGFEWDTWGTFASGPNPMSPSNGDPHSQPSAGH